MELLTAVKFGNFNKCPATEVIVKKSKYWYEKCEAEIKEISHDSIKYSIPDSLDLQKTNELKDEILQFAPDSISINESETEFEKNIIKDKYFYLWWD